MALKTLLPVLALAISYTSAFEFRHVRSTRLATSSSVDLPEAPFVVSLTDKVPRPSFKKRALRELRSNAHTPVGDPTATVFGSDDDEEYLTDITVGGQSFKAIVDTGRYALIVLSLWIYN